jgi:RNA polymerase sigma-70 factor (family 1)
MNRTEFDKLVHDLNRKLFGYAFRILRHQEEAEDAVQEVFIKLWKIREKLREYNSIEALATTMVKNYCIDQIRKQKNIQSSGDVSENRVNFVSPSPLDQMEMKESEAIIHKIIDTLPDLYKSVILLKDIEDRSYEEISELTNQNINTLRVNLSRARKFVRDEFNKFQYENRGFEKSSRKVL